MIRSLRMRLFLGTTLLSAILFSILGITIISAVGHTLQAEYDRVLLEKARTLASLVEQSGTEIHFDYRRSLFPEFEPGENSDYFEMLLDGKPFARSLSLEDAHLPLGATPPAATPRAIAATLPNGRPGRRITLQFQPIPEIDAPPRGPSHTVVLALAIKTTDLTRTMGRIELLVVALCAAATLLAGMALLLVVGAAIAPVKVLAAQIEAVRLDAKTSDNSSAFITAPIPSELKPLVDRLNDLLQRLADAFSRERSFTADAAHELRTPLAGLLTTLEVCRTRPRGSAEYESAIDKCLAMLSQMRGMTEKLLLLSRADAGQVTVRRAPVELAPLLEGCWQPFESPARARGISLRVLADDAEGATVVGDAELLRIVFSNLFDNAVAYSRAGGVIETRATPRDGRIVVTVANEGHALAQADLPRLFERFWRKDAARASTGRHAGLGLSLCQRLLALQGGTIAARIEADRFVVEATLPASEKCPAPQAYSDANA